MSMIIFPTLYPELSGNKAPKIPTASTVCVEHTVVHATKGDGMFQIMTLELVMKQQSVVLSYSIVVKLSGTNLGRLDKV